MSHKISQTSAKEYKKNEMKQINNLKMIISILYRMDGAGFVLKTHLIAFSAMVLFCRTTYRCQ